MYINITTSGGANDHVHVEEDISAQSDGYNLVFTTSQDYTPGTLNVFYNGVLYRSGADNDFLETGNKEFTFPFDGYGVDDLFPPKNGCSLHIQYRRKLV